MGIKVLSLFDGISTGRLALERAGIDVDVYYASEIDKNAEAVSRYHYPDIVRLGDVKSIDFNQFKDVDLILSGSPCTDLSAENRNRAGLYGKHSSLFFYFLDALNVIKPKWFLQENVASMRNVDKQLITEYLHSYSSNLDCIAIDSALVSAQVRKRLYWTNIPTDQPTNQNIFLTNVLETIELDNYVVLCPNIYTDGAVKIVDNHVVATNGKRVDITSKHLPCCFKEVRTEQGKALRRQARLEGGKDTTPRTAACKMFVPKTDNKANCLTTSKNAATTVQQECGSNLVIRHLTPLECDRLQTMGDDYTKYGLDNYGNVCEMSYSARYKMLGNGWTCDVIAHIFKGMLQEQTVRKSRGLLSSIIN